MEFADKRQSPLAFLTSVKDDVLARTRLPTLVQTYHLRETFIIAMLVGSSLVTHAVTKQLEKKKKAICLQSHDQYYE